MERSDAMIAALAQADFKFTLDPNVPKPVIVGGNGDLTSNDPTVTKLDTGYQMTKLSYTVKAKDANGIAVDWITQREFELDTASTITVRIEGDIKISWTGGTLRFGVVGGIDDNVVGLTTFTDPKQGDQPPQGPKNNYPEKWDQSGSKDFDKGTHQLIMYTSLGWNPAAKDDSIVFEMESTYKVTMTATPIPGAVPEPSSLALCTVGSLALVSRPFYRAAAARWRQKRGQKKET
jgi:hypothetical protein